MAKNLKKAMKKLLVERPTQEIANAILDTVPWDKLMLALANVCCFNANQAKIKKQKKGWVARSRVLHRAMDEIYLQKSHGSPFKITRRDIYTCKCKKRFVVDPSTEKNIAWSLDQCEFVVTCPYCSKKEDLKKAKTFREKKHDE